MPRSDWRILAAALGCLTLTGVAEGKDQQRQKRQQASQTQSGPAAPAVFKPEHRPDDSNDAKAQCVNDAGAKQDCDAAAAQATVDQAGYAFWQTVAGVIGTFAGVGTLVAAVWAGSWAKKAAEHTETGAVAAVGALDHARLISRRELRAYLDVEDVVRMENPKREGGSSGPLGFAITLKNYGSTPTGTISRTFQYSLRRIGFDRAIIGDVTDQPGNIAPGDTGILNDDLILDSAIWARVVNGYASIVIAMEIGYADVFDDWHQIFAEFETDGNEPIFLVSGTKRTD